MADFCSAVDRQAGCSAHHHRTKTANREAVISRASACNIKHRHPIRVGSDIGGTMEINESAFVNVARHGTEWLVDARSRDAFGAPR